MQKFELNEDNLILFLMKHYDNPGCSGIQEFHDDVKRFKYVRRLFKKYEEQQLLRERLIINHLVVLNNLFGIDTVTQVLLYKIDQKHHSYLKTFMLYLNMNTDKIDDISIDDTIANKLRNL